MSRLVDIVNHNIAVSLLDHFVADISLNVANEQV